LRLGTRGVAYGTGCQDDGISGDDVIIYPDVDPTV
jgi:hypothetical protein